MSLRKLLFGVLAPLAVGLACGGIQQVEIDCEEAVAYLTTCCPGFDANALGCASSQNTTTDGCDTTTTTTYPALTSSEVSCIRGETCEALVASGVCARAQAAREYTVTTTTGDDAATTSTGSEDPGVCP
jgi:hypothetical protein